MSKRIGIFCLLVSCIAGSVFAEGSPAFFVVRKGFKQNLVQVDGKLLSFKEFNAVCKEKSPAAAELLKLSMEERGSSFFGGVFGCVFAIAGYNRYLSSRDITDNQGIATRQAEGLGFMLLSIVSSVKSQMNAIAADDSQIKAIELYNRDTDRIKLSLGVQNNLKGFTLSKKF